MNFFLLEWNGIRFKFEYMRKAQIGSMLYKSTYSYLSKIQVQQIIKHFFILLANEELREFFTAGISPCFAPGLHNWICVKLIWQICEG
jgi:hypothetical protein